MMTTSTEDTTPEKTSRFGANKAVAAGLAVGVLGGTAAGLVFGVPGLTSAASSDVAVVQQVDDNGTDLPADTPPDAPADAPADIGTHLRDALQPIVDDNTITSDQADAVVKQLVENRPDRGERRGPGGHHRGPGMPGRGMDPAVLTDVLGLDGQELMTQLRDGKTLAEIAAEQNVEPQAVVDALVADAKAHLDQAVTDGRIDQAEADQKLADATTRITDMVNNGRPDRDADRPVDAPTDQPD